MEEQFFHFRTDKKITIKVEPPEVECSLIRRMGKPKFWVSQNDFESLMERIYKTTSKKVREILSEGK